LGSRRGQVWSVDFAAGLVLLAFLLLMFIIVWNNLAARWNISNSYRQMETDALFVSEALIATSGEPGGWEMLANLNETQAIGLSGGRNEISAAKMERLVAGNASSYDFIRARLGVQRYDLGIRVTNLGRNETFYEFGKFAPGLRPSVIYERMGLLNGSPVILHTEVWR